MQPSGNKYGFTLVVVIFMIAVLGILGGAMIKMFEVQSRSTTLSHQGIRAYYAAKSALEWGKNKTLNNTDACLNNATYTAQEFFAGDTSFDISVNCTREVYTEGSRDYVWYRLSARAEQGEYGDPDYVTRKLTLQLVSPR